MKQKRLPNLVARQWLLDTSHDGRLEGLSYLKRIDDRILKFHIKRAYRNETRRTQKKIGRAFVCDDLSEQLELSKRKESYILQILLNRNSVHPLIKEEIITNPQTDPSLIRHVLRSIEDPRTPDDIRQRLRNGLDQRTYLLLRMQ